MDKREIIARRVAREFRDGDIVNLGIGIPTLVANFLPAGMEVILHTENGMLGVGPYPPEQEADPDLVNAGKEPVTEIPGASYFSSADSFAMIRGGHVDVAVLGGMEVDEEGNLASWMVPGQTIRGMGGSMDLVAGARRVIVAMEHTRPDGSPKIVKRCKLPLTGARVVHTIITEFAVISVRRDGLWLEEIASEISLEELQARSEARLHVDHDQTTPSRIPGS
jgi:3-oxoacid CoA-transferase subunit B